MNWLLASIDPSRAHEVSVAVSWHARLMLLAWGIFAPLAVLAARFFKIMPGQDWPHELDNRVWWNCHWMGQTAVAVLSVVALLLVLPTDFSTAGLHNWLGTALLGLLLVQVLLGVFRGSKGGPTAPAPDGSPRGHHYDMTTWRLTFEVAHKIIGYLALGLAIIVILTGLWKTNAPVWMWIVLWVWWSCLVGAFIVFQRRGMAVDTYQAIWGPEPSHPGNRLPPPGWGMRRPGDTKKEG